ncbi:hypothetical protein ACP8HI_18175 [Paenibacillus sp. FA6]|uniref:hypothetical protein n=1 Tax=Paenibacillus sp. FA6 TaxID=3413029 RepID=UPI003F656F41
MNGNKELGTEARFDVEIQQKENMDIIKIMAQCNIAPERWKAYINEEQNRL